MSFSIKVRGASKLNSYLHNVTNFQNPNERHRNNSWSSTCNLESVFWLSPFRTTWVQNCQTLRLLLNPVILALDSAVRLRPACPIDGLCPVESLVFFHTSLLLNPLCLLASVSYAETARRRISPSCFPNCIFKEFDDWIVQRCRLLGSVHVQSTLAEQDGP